MPVDPPHPATRYFYQSTSFIFLEKGKKKSINIWTFVVLVPIYTEWTDCCSIKKGRLFSELQKLNFLYSSTFKM